MKIVTFVSHYFMFKANSRLTDGMYILLMKNKSFSPIELYNLDVDCFSHGNYPQIFSAGQLIKLKKSLLGTEYWDHIF